MVIVRKGADKTAARDTAGNAPVPPESRPGVSKTAKGGQATTKSYGKSGPPSSLDTKKGSPTGASAGGDGNFEGRRGEAKEGGAMAYTVQVHTDEKGLEVFDITAKTGDEAAQKALEKKNYRGASVRGVTPKSDPDPNSMGGERDASIMYANADGDSAIDPLGTEANRKATEKLGHQDVTELGE